MLWISPRSISICKHFPVTSFFSCCERRARPVDSASRFETPQGARALLREQNGLHWCPLVGENCRWTQSREDWQQTVADLLVECFDRRRPTKRRTMAIGADSWMCSDTTREGSLWMNWRRAKSSVYFRQNLFDLLLIEMEARWNV